MFSPHRIAFVSEGVMLGGSTTFLCNLSGEMVRRGIQSEIFSFKKDNPFASDFHHLNVPVFCEDEDRNIFEDRISSILRRIHHFKPTVVVANIGPSSHETLRYMPDGVFRIGMVHADSTEAYELLKCYSEHMDAVVTVSEKIQFTVNRDPRFSGKNVIYLPAGVPMPQATPTPRPISTDSIRILYFGRLEQAQKRVHLFPKILRRLQLKSIPLTWTIAGSGSDENFLRTEMQNYQSQKICFAGRVSYSDISQLLMTHDIFVLTSDYEGLPLTLLEAMGHGVVPVVSDLPSGINEVVDATSGIRVSPADIDGYADAIADLHRDPGMLRQLSVGAHERVKRHFSLTAMGDRWIDFLSHINKASIQWPSSWSIQRPMNSPQDIRFTAAGRMTRRIIKTIKAKIS